MVDYLPPAAFYFGVTVLGSDSPSSDASFEEVSGLQADLEFETVPEGGENRFAYRLPTRAKYSNLMLKRGLVVDGSFLANWAGTIIGNPGAAVISPRGLTISLFNEKGQPLVTWSVTRAYPVRWQIAPFNAMDNKIATETMEFTFDYVERRAASRGT